MNIKKFNDDIGKLLPFLAKRLTSGVPFQIPTSGAELSAQAKREAAFAMRHRADQITNALSAASEKTAKAKNKSTVGILQGLAQIVEATILDLTSEDEEEKSEKSEDQKENNQPKDDNGIIDIG